MTSRWEETFLPALTEAFSCDAVMHDEDWEEEQSMLPPDIDQTFAASFADYKKGVATWRGRGLVPKIWRLTKGYLMSAQKQREMVNRQQVTYKYKHNNETVSHSHLSHLVGFRLLALYSVYGAACRQRLP